MTESLIPVEGVAYTANVFDDLLVALTLKDNAATQGVIKGAAGGPFGYNLLAVTGAASPIAVDSGAAWVNGKLYKNSASKNVNVASPAAATRIDRLVLHLDYTAGPPATCVAQLLAGAEGGAAPALTQTDGTTWQLSLAQVSITVGGVITLTDERAYAGDGHVLPASLAASVAGNGLAGGAGTALSVNVDDSTIEINADTLRVKDAGITAAKIANRTRALWVPVTGGYNTTDAVYIHQASAPGMPLMAAKLSTCWGSFYVPSDWVSGLTIKVVLGQVATASANVYVLNQADHGAAGEAYDVHTNSVAYAAVAVTHSKINVITTLTPTNVTAGDYFSLTFARDGTNGGDTLNYYCYLLGWLIEYTADS